MTLIERFWRKVKKGTPLECWPWIGALKGGGYGNFGVCRGRNTGAHRMAFVLTSGRTLNERELVLHKCDNPPCCNPAHLFAGTYKDNIADARMKGRLATGDRHGLRKHPDRIARGERGSNAKLSESQVLEIRRMHGPGMGYIRLGRKFGVSTGAIQSIINRTNWTHI